MSQNYYGLLECLAQDHMSFISNLEPQVFLYILSTISEGLTALGEYENDCALFPYCIGSFRNPGYNRSRATCAGRKGLTDGLVGEALGLTCVHVA